MHRSLFVVALTALAALAGCSGNDGKISVAASDSALTDNGADKLFTVKLEDDNKHPYDIKTLVVKATPDGKDAITVGITVHDTNGNGLLDKDETIDCVEGAANDFGKDLSGKDVKVELFATIDGKSDERVGDATWTPK
jgi:hypothetical protein